MANFLIYLLSVVPRVDTYVGADIFSIIVWHLTIIKPLNSPSKNCMENMSTT